MYEHFYVPHTELQNAKEELQVLQAKYNEEMREIQETAATSLARERSTHQREIQELREHTSRSRSTWDRGEAKVEGVTLSSPDPEAMQWCYRHSP